MNHGGLTIIFGAQNI